VCEVHSGFRVHHARVGGMRDDCTCRISSPVEPRRALGGWRVVVLCGMSPGGECAGEARSGWTSSCWRGMDADELKGEGHIICSLHCTESETPCDNLDSRLCGQTSVLERRGHEGGGGSMHEARYTQSTSTTVSRVETGVSPTTPTTGCTACRERAAGTNRGRG